MKIVVTTSNAYHHLLPIFFYLYGKYWNEPFDLVGYDKPTCELPDNCTWVSLGVQGGKNEFSTDMRRYFATQPEWFVWMMEDSFLKDNVRGGIDKIKFPSYQLLGTFGIGRVCLTGDILKRGHRKFDECSFADDNSRYRLSTQPSIWNKNFLLKYLTPGLSPWNFETQDPMNDDWIVLCHNNPPVKHNEGVRRFDIHKLNLDGMCQEDINHIQTLITW